MGLYELGSIGRHSGRATSLYLPKIAGLSRAATSGSVEMARESFKLEYTLKTLEWGARYLAGENLKVVWAEFSTLSLAVLLDRNTSRFSINYFIFYKLFQVFLKFKTSFFFNLFQN